MEAQDHRHHKKYGGAQPVAPAYQALDQVGEEEDKAALRLKIADGDKHSQKQEQHRAQLPPDGKHRLLWGRGVHRLAAGFALAVRFAFAAILARSKGIFHLVTGVSEADYSGYPDCRDTFIRSLNVTLNLAMDEQFVLHTPLMNLDKSEVWELSDQLGVFDYVRTHTLTCYNGIPGDGCGHCPACKLRNEGLRIYLQRRNH